jgi:hypothetical protein
MQFVTVYRIANLQFGFEIAELQIARPKDGQRDFKIE